MLFIRRILLSKAPSTASKNAFRIERQSRWFATSENFEKYEKVRTTGFTYLDAEGNQCAKYAIYWGDNDPRNVIRSLPSGSSHVAAKLRAILEVIHVAREEESTPSLLIYTDLQRAEDMLNTISGYARRDFYTRNGATKVKNADIFEDLFNAVQGLTLKIVHKSTSCFNDSKNNVVEAIISDVKRRCHNEEPSNTTDDGQKVVENVLEPLARLDVEVGTTLDKDGHEVSNPKENWPTVYVAQKTVEKDDFFASGYCTHWPGGECPSGGFRFMPFPVTEFRSELAAIEHALKQAEEASLRGVTVVTSSAHFMIAWKCRWKRLNGRGLFASKSEFSGVSKHPQKEFFASKIFYDRISEMVKRIGNVHFRYERTSPESEIGKELMEKCEKGLMFPVARKDTSEYKLRIQDLVKSKDSRQKNIPLIRIFKTGTELNAGYTWHPTADSKPETSVNCAGTPSVLVTVLEQAVSKNHEKITIRADSEKLIKSYEALLEVWRRNDWKNSQSKEIARQKEWEQAWRLKQRVRVNWEWMETVDEEDIVDNKTIPEFASGKKWPKRINRRKKAT